MYYTLKLGFVFLCLILNFPLGKAEIIYKSPPVEKVKPPVEKNKKTKTLKARKNIKKITATQKERDYTTSLITLIMLSLLVIAVMAGIFLFGFGLYSFPLWLTGIILIGGANLLMFLFALIAVGDTEDKTFFKHTDNIAFWFILVLLAVINLIAGLTFLIWGLVVLIPFIWTIGIIILAIMLLSVLACFLFTRYRAFP